MAVILNPRNYDVWLDPTIEEPTKLQHVLAAYPPEGMIAYPARTLVNNPVHDAPECIEPIAK